MLEIVLSLLELTRVPAMKAILVQSAKVVRA